MTEYYVRLNVAPKRLGKTIKCSSLIEARRKGIELLMDGGLRYDMYNYVMIYTSKVTKSNWNKPKYVIRPYNYYGGKINPYHPPTFISSTVGVGANGGWGYTKFLLSDGRIKR